MIALVQRMVFQSNMNVDVFRIFQMTITGLMVMLFSKTTHRKSCLVCFFIEIFPSIDINEILVVGQNLWLFLSPFISSLCSSDGHHDCDTHEQVNPSSCNLCKISCLQNS